MLDHASSPDLFLTGVTAASVRVAPCVPLQVKKLHADALLPRYATAGAACFDLHALMPAGRTLHLVNPGVASVMRTGLAFGIPEGWAMLIYSRSGHGFNHDTRLANCVGVIDHDYVGEVMVKLTRDAGHGPELVVRHGDRIAQAMLVPVTSVMFNEVDDLPGTERGTGGFGSTGR